jgi:hypothetical protein
MHRLELNFSSTAELVTGLTLLAAVLSILFV